MEVQVLDWPPCCCCCRLLDEVVVVVVVDVVDEEACCWLLRALELNRGELVEDIEPVRDSERTC